MAWRLRRPPTKDNCCVAETGLGSRQEEIVRPLDRDPRPSADCRGFFIACPWRCTSSGLLSGRLGSGFTENQLIADYRTAAELVRCKLSVACHTRPDLGAQSEFVLGLDTLRFFAALMVAVTHLCRNLPVSPPSEAVARIFYELALLANGQAAVGLFFVISGFCIHFRQATSLRVETGIFLARRTVRIGLPMAAVALFAASLGPWARAALQSVLWSLYCELAYYLTYPILLACRRKWPMTRLLAAAVLVSAITVFLLPKGDILQDYGIPVVVIGFPLWLMGAWLAERHHEGRPAPKGSIYAWRVTALFLCWLFPFGPYGPIDASAATKLALVGIFSAFYLPAELAHWSKFDPPAWTEMLGASSYSLYLGHIIPVACAIQIQTGLSFWPAIAVDVAAIAIFTFATYRLFEAPAHQLVRAIGRKGPTRVQASGLEFEQ